MTRLRGPRAVVAAAAVALGGAAGGPGWAEEQAVESEQQRQAMTMTYEIGVTTEGTFSPLGTLSFDGANNGTLVLGAYHPRTPHLVQVWENLSDRDTIHIKKSVPVRTDDGGRKFRLIGVDVAKADPEFPAALLRYIAHEYGFDSRP